MEAWLLSEEPTFRLSVFVGVVLAVVLAETLWPRRSRTLARLQRWPSNIGIVIVNTLLLRLLIPTAAVALAIKGEAEGWGLLRLAELPDWLAFVLALLLLDLAIYLQHMVFHMVPFLWRLHRMHHADQDFDVTTGARFHPLEILISMAIKMALVWLIGPSALAVLIFEVVLNATAMFNHGNLRLPLGFDRVLRWVVVTPDMHRVHHSIRRYETDSNYGFNLPWWDRLFGTYRAQPEDGHDAMTIGIEAFRTAADQRLDRMLVQPFRKTGG